MKHVKLVEVRNTVHEGYRSNERIYCIFKVFLVNDVGTSLKLKKFSNYDALMDNISDRRVKLDNARLYALKVANFLNTYLEEDLYDGESNNKN